MSNQLVVIDARVSDYQSLIDQLGSAYTYLLLSPDSDGITQIADYVSANSGFNAIHLIAHGAPGQVNVGNAKLSEATVVGYSDQLNQIGGSINDGGDFLIYGCRVAQGPSGQRLITDIARLTKRGVAASTDNTGSNGDWVLEATVRPISHSLPQIQFAGDLTSLPDISWARFIGQDLRSRPLALSIGSDGSVYIAGDTSGEFDHARNVETQDIFIKKYASDGTETWVRTIGSNRNEFITAIARGPNGSVYLAGETTSTILDGQTNPNETDNATFIAKFTSTGSKDWTRFVASKPVIGYEWSTGLAAEPDGSFFLVGTLNGTVDGQTSAGGPDVYVKKFLANGTNDWKRTIGGSGYEDASSATTALNGAIYLVGSTDSPRLDGQDNAGLSDAFITKFAANGKSEWTSLIGSTGRQSGRSVTTGANGSIYVVGSTDSSLDDQPIGGVNNAFVTKFAVNGAKEWTRLIGSNSSVDGRAVAVGSDGSVYVLGTADGSFDYQSSAGFSDLFITKFEPNGDKVWTKLIGTKLDDSAEALAIAPDGSLYVVGRTESSNFEGQTNPGNGGGFIFKLATATDTGGESGSMPETTTPTTITAAELNALDSASLAMVSTATVTSLTTDQVALLTTTTISRLTVAQIQAFEPVDLAVFSSSQLRTLSISQVLALTPDALSALSNAQTTYLASAAFSAMSLDQIVSLAVAQIRKVQLIQSVSTASIAALSTQALGGAQAWLSSLSSTQLGALSSSAVGVLNTAALTNLQTGQIAGLRAEQLVALTTTQMPYLGVGVLNALSSSQLRAIEGDDIAALTSTQVQGLSTRSLALLSTSQVRSIEPTDVSTLSSSQFRGLSSAQVVALTTGQLASLSTTQALGLTTQAMPGFNLDQIKAFPFAQSAAGLAQFAAITTAQVAAFTPEFMLSLGDRKDLSPFTSAQLGAISTSVIPLLNSAELRTLQTGQIAGLRAEQLVALTTTQMPYLGVGVLNALSSSQLRAIEGEDIAALTSTQVQGLSTRSLALLSTSQVRSLETQDIAELTTAQIRSLPVQSLNQLTTSQLRALGTTGIRALATTQVSALSTTQFNALTTAQVFNLDFNGVTTTQVSNQPIDNLNVLYSADFVNNFAIQFRPPSTTQQLAALVGASRHELIDASSISYIEVYGDFKYVSTRSLSLFSSSQVAALTSSGFDQLNSSQIAVLSTGVIASITSSALGSLKTSQLPGLRAEQLVALTTTQMPYLSVGVLNALSSSQLRAIEGDDIAALTSTQVQGLTSLFLNSLTSMQVRAIEPGDIAALTTVQVRGLSSVNMNTLTSTQIQAVETTDIRVLTTAQIRALATQQFQALQTTQIQALNSAQLSVMSTGQIAAFGLSTNQLMALTSNALAALTSQQIQAIGNLKALTPLVLDLHQDGISTASLANGTVFDLGNTGTPVRTGWVARGDGLLVRDINGDGVINDGGELFGEGTILSTGRKARDGYEALKALDSNHDGVIDANDTSFKELAVWIDQADGITQSSELKTLTELGISSFSLAATQSTIIDNGNLIGLMGSYTTADGKTHTMGDVWFQVDPSGQSVFDLATALVAHRTSADSGKLQLSQIHRRDKLTVTLDDVLHLGHTDVIGQVALVIDTGGSHPVDLSASGQWSNSGPAMIGGEQYVVYVDPLRQATLLVNDKLNVLL